MKTITWESTYRETMDTDLNVTALRKNGSIDNIIVVSIGKIELTNYYRVEIPCAMALFCNIQTFSYSLTKLGASPKKQKLAL
jgi:hypothetical protein